MSEKVENQNAQGMTNFQTCVSFGLVSIEKKKLDSYLDSLEDGEEKQKLQESTYYKEICKMHKRLSKISNIILDVETEYKEHLPKRILDEVE